MKNKTGKTANKRPVGRPKLYAAWVGVRLPGQQVKSLEIISQKTGLCRSDVLRAAIDSYIESQSA